MLGYCHSMARFKSVGFPATIDGSEISTNRGPIPIDDLLPINEEPKAYLERRVNFYIALLEELIRRGASRGDIYFMKDCVDALLKMTTVGRAKVDLNVGGGLSKLRDEIDFSKMEVAEIDEFLRKARGELGARDDTILVDPSRGDVHIAVRDEKPKAIRRRHKRSSLDNSSGQGDGKQIAIDGPGSSTPDGAD
jgi:hypothetical protein